MDHIEGNVPVCVPIKLYLQKEIWLARHGFPTSVLEHPSE